MDKKRTIFDKILDHQQIPVILVLLLCIAGIFSFIKIPKQEFPNFTVLEGLVIAVFPGASSEQVDARVAKPLQDYLFSYREVDRVHTYSVSKEGQCVVFLYINSGVKEGEFWPKLQIGLQEFKSQLPAQTLALTAVSDFGDYSTILLSLASDKRTYRELETYCNRLSDMVRAYSEVSSIQTFGMQEEEVSVYVDARQLAFYGIDPALISANIRLSTLAGYGSAVNSGGLKMPIRLPGEYRTEADLAEQIILTTPQGRIIRLKDVAEIRREYIVDTSFVECNGKRAVGLSISMSIGNNVIDFGTHIDKIIDSFKKDLPADVEIIKVADQPSVVNTSITHFFRDFAIAIISVIIVIVLFLPRRIATVAAITIPVVVLIDMTILNLLGIQLDTVSLAALTMALGIIVDDPVVVIDNYVEKLDEGQSLRDAATGSVRELFSSILTATLAIVAAFLPMNFYLDGMNRDFIKPAPISVAIALPMSFFIAMSFVPILNYRFIKTGLASLKKAKSKKTTLERAQDFYNNVYLASAMRHPKRALTIGVFCIALGIGLFIISPRQPFPKLEHSNFAVEIYFPEGTSLSANEKVTKEVANLIRADKRVENVVSFFGSSSPRFSVLYAPQIPALNYSQLIVNTYTNKQTEDIIKEYSQKYTDAWPEAHVRWKQLDFLPNDAPIEIQISGDDIPSIKIFADEVKKLLAEEDDIIWVKDDYRNPLLAIDVNMNDEIANRLGVTKGVLALSTAIAHSEIPVATIWDGDYAKTVYLRSRYQLDDDNSMAVPDDVLDLYVITPEKNTPVVLREIAGIEPGFTEGQIVRRNGRYTIMVSGDVAYGKLASDIFDRVSRKIGNLQKPDSISIYYAGQHELEMEVFIPFGFSLATSVVIIFILLLFQFKNVRDTFLVMSSMPLAFVGAIAGLLIIGYPFGITSFMGLIGLLGIVTRNGIVFVSYANELREKGMSAKEAAAAAGERRMRPIFLTASAAAAGVIPLITSGSLLWGPLGSVICFGLVGSTLLTLYVLPVAYWKFSGESYPKPQNDQNNPNDQNDKGLSGE
ncbi:MAG: efflux RND transporter permease subunit [Spirochaetaceae bacterium]|jgi:multidrug efflux pump subunit AcrB|nr:efflux RND transporter permease subunit [Spirochaetaceae bacterium]